MSIALVDREPTQSEFERFRLLLSTFQDGSGGQANADGSSTPGWRDFERTVAAAFGGVSQENKFIFDVLISHPNSIIKCGISCKMRGELNRVDRDGRITIELSNSAKKFYDYLLSKGIRNEEYGLRASEVGVALVEVVEGWKKQVSTENKGVVDIARSSYLALMYNRAGHYQLYWLPSALPDPNSLDWYYTINHKGQRSAQGHLNGDEVGGGRVFEWYEKSGGQLKYYPKTTDAKWISPRFRLEPLPDLTLNGGLASKAQQYFPDQWKHLT